MQITAAQFLVIIAARARSAAAVFVAVLVIALVVSLLMPKRYTASAAVVLDVRSPDPVAGSLLAGMLAPGYMATQVDVASSERVARRVIHALGMHNSEALRTEWLQRTGGKGDFEAWLAEDLQRGLDVTPSRDSNVVTISFSAADPLLAASTAGAFMQAYIDTSLELKVEPARAYNSFFDERAKQLREAVEAAQARLSAFQETNQLLVTTERIDIENSRLGELSSQLVVLQSNAAQNDSKRQQAGARPEQLPEVLSNAVVSAFAGTLAIEEARLQELTARYGENHPQWIEQRAKVADLKRKAATATARASGAVNVTASVNQAQLAQTQKALNEQRARVLRMQSLRDEAAVLRRDVDNAQTAFNTMQERVTQTGVESQNTRTNVSVLKRATAPVTASSPKLVRNLGVAAFLGALLALITAFVREMRDRRLRTVSDIEFELRQPLLLTLPVAALPDSSTRRAPSLAMTSRALRGRLGAHAT